MEQRKNYQRVIMTATTRAPDEIDSTVYDTKVRINHWNDKMMEHKKIYYAAELKMYKLELALAKYDNSHKLRWRLKSEPSPTPDEDGKKSSVKSIGQEADDNEIRSSTSEIGCDPHSLRGL